MTDKILTPIDLTDMETSAKVLQAAVDQTRIKDGTLIVLTVVPEVLAGIDFRYAIRGETGGSAALDMDKIVADALVRLNEVVAERTPAGMKVTTIARHGAIYEEILEVAEEMGVDQIVLGAHNPGLDDFLLGSNTDRIVRHAKCSVNVIRP